MIVFGVIVFVLACLWLAIIFILADRYRIEAQDYEEKCKKPDLDRGRIDPQ